MLKVDGKVTIVGDVHGQFYDFHEMLQKLYKQKKEGEKMLFLGDYVDRGAYGPQLMLLLLILKVNSPQNFLCLRGNHETRDMTEQYKFYESQIMARDDQPVS